MQVVGHNHTYTLPQASGATPRSQTRDKKNSKKNDDEHLSRDEKRARAANVSCHIYISKLAKRTKLEPSNKFTNYGIGFFRFQSQ